MQNQSNQKQDSILSKNKDRIIDSLKAELKDCQGQAYIMADILEEERIELAKKKATN